MEKFEKVWGQVVARAWSDELSKGDCLPTLRGCWRIMALISLRKWPSRWWRTRPRWYTSSCRGGLRYSRKKNSNWWPAGSKELIWLPKQWLINQRSAKFYRLERQNRPLKRHDVLKDSYNLMSAEDRIYWQGKGPVFEVEGNIPLILNQGQHAWVVLAGGVNLSGRKFSLCRSLKTPSLSR